MAIIPKGAELMELASMRSPQLKFHNIFIFPGVPELVRNRFFSLKEMFRSGEIFLKIIYLNTEEGQIARALDSTCAEFPELMLGSYPALWNKDYSVKLTLESRKEAYLDQAMKFLISKIPKEHIIRNE
jgi:molybdopterin-biosynthesis enzyme MoeA-like protein